MHLIPSGHARVEHPDGSDLEITEPSVLLLFPRPLLHGIISAPTVGADLACTHVLFEGGTTNPVANALPNSSNAKIQIERISEEKFYPTPI